MSTTYRPSWDEYFLKLAMLASERATCPRMHCGCILVKDRYVLASGYNGSIPGQPHCEDVGCLIVENHCVRTNHAEINALVQAARHGTNVTGCTAYITNMSCTTCAKALIAAGITRVVVFTEFHDTLAFDFYTQSGVEVVKMKIPEKIIHYDEDSYISARKTDKSG
jgi:dCMP deaminase